MEELYPAQLDGFDLEIETLDDAFEYAIAKHEIPNKNGAQLENMGERAHPVNIRCYFWDHGDHQTYAAHIELVKHIRATAGKLLELIHPQYGAMKGMVERITTRHDDRNTTAEVDLTFIEDQSGILADVQYEDVESATEDAFIRGQDEQIAELGSDLSTAGLDVATNLDPEQNILDQVKSSLASVREMARELDGYVNMAKGVAGEVEQAADSVVATVNYGVNLPGRIIGTVAHTVERLARGFDSIKTSPARFMNSLKFAFSNLVNKFGMFSDSHSRSGEKARAIMVKHVRIACAQRMALEAAYAYSADEKNRQQVRAAESAASFDAAGRYIGLPMPDPVLNVRELEESLADTRELLQDGITQARSMESLKAMARSLLEHVNTVKLERERIITITLDNPTPLHLVCLMYGLNYNMAERICSINNISNPNFVSGEIQIYVR